MPPGSRVPDGLTVLDVGSWVAGPAAATVMADLGARVIRIEGPGAVTPTAPSRGSPGAGQ